MSTRSTRRGYLKALSALGVELVVAGCRKPTAQGSVDAGQEQPGGEDQTREDDGDEDEVEAVQAQTETAAAVAKPHVLFISIDDLNDWVGVLGGHPQAKTPNIDALARSGVLFANAHCAAPSCNGSRTATLTGLRPSTTGIYGNPQPWRQHLPDVVTLPEYFRTHGYKVLGAGKLFHGPYPDPRGWDAFFPSKCRQRPPDKLGLGHGGPRSGVPRLGHFDWGAIDKSDDDLSDAHVVDWVTKHLPDADAPPTFLACGLFRPHLPWYVPKKWFDMFPLDAIELPKVRQDDRDDIPRAVLKKLTIDDDHAKITAQGKWKAAVQAYLASCAFADAMVGRLMAALRKSPAADRTVVVFWSDHGWHLGEKLHWRKFTLWEEATRVPLVIAGPPVTAPAVCTRAVGLVDLYPTLLEICGLPEKSDLEGRSLVELLQHPDARWPSTAITTWGRGNHAIRTDRWRYIRYKRGAEELYDHDADPHEWTNLAHEKKHRALMDRLAEKLPQRDAPWAPRASEYSREDFECDPATYGEDDGTEDARED